MSLLFALTAVAAAAGQAPAAAPPQPKAAAEKKICKREETTGSRVNGKRVCKTRAQWDAIQREAQEAMRTSGNLSPGSSSN